MKKKHGFTLIELLTVIAIIGILSAILIPTVLSMLKGGHNSKCKASLRGLGQAAIRYSADENDRLPFAMRSTHASDSDKPASATEFYASEIGPYLDLRPTSGNYISMDQIGEKKLMDCPTALKEDRASGSNRHCFGVNTLLNHATNSDGRIYLSDMIIPTKTMYMGETEFAGGTWPIALTTSNIRHQHKRSSTNFVFIDSHVKGFQEGFYPTNSAATTPHPGNKPFIGKTFWTGQEPLP